MAATSGSTPSDVPEVHRIPPDVVALEIAGLFAALDRVSRQTALRRVHEVTMAYRPQSDDYRQAIVDFGGGGLAIARAIAAALPQLETESEIYDGCRAVRGLSGSPRAVQVTTAFVGCLSASTMSTIASFMRRRDISADAHEQVIGAIMNSLRQPTPLRNAWVACGGIEAEAELIQLYLPLAIGDGAPPPPPAATTGSGAGAAPAPAPSPPPACPVARFCLYSLVALARDPALHFAFTGTVRAALRAAAAAPALEVRSVAFMTLAHLAQTFDAEDEPTSVGVGGAGSGSSGISGSHADSGGGKAHAGDRDGVDGDEVHIDAEAISFIVGTLRDTLNPVPGRYYGWKVPELVAALLSVSASDANKGRLGAEAVDVLLDVLEAPAQSAAWVPAVQALHNLCYNGREERRAAQAAVLKSEPSFTRRLAALAASTEAEVARNAQCTLEALGIYAVKDVDEGMSKHTGLGHGDGSIGASAGAGAGGPSTGDVDLNPTVAPQATGLPRSPSSAKRGGRRAASGASTSTETGLASSSSSTSRGTGATRDDARDHDDGAEDRDGSADGADDADDCADVEDEDEDNETFDVMISYSWATQTTVLRVAAELRRLGLRVWLDVEHMGADLIASMAHAVEASTVFLLCCSSAYKASPNCRREANYCAALNKPVLVANMEHEYVPRGWLGLHVAGKIWADFREDSDDCFLRGMRTLCKQLIEQGVATPALRASVGSSRSLRGAASSKSISVPEPASTSSAAIVPSTAVVANPSSAVAPAAVVAGTTVHKPDAASVAPATPAQLDSSKINASSGSSGRVKVTWDVTVADDSTTADDGKTAPQQTAPKPATGPTTVDVTSVVSTDAAPVPTPAQQQQQQQRQHQVHGARHVAHATAPPVIAAEALPSPPPPPPAHAAPPAHPFASSSPQPHFGGGAGFQVAAPMYSPLTSPSVMPRPHVGTALGQAAGMDIRSPWHGGASVLSQATPVDARVEHLLSCLASYGHMRLAAALSSGGFSSLSLDGLQRLCRSGDVASFHRLVQDGFGVGLADSLALSALLATM